MYFGQIHAIYESSLIHIFISSMSKSYVHPLKDGMLIDSHQHLSHLTSLFLLWQNAQRLAAGAQVAQTLTTPVVSVATPSLLAQGLPFSAMPTAYNTGEIIINISSEFKLIPFSFVLSSLVFFPSMYISSCTASPCWR